jgi:hypothetical protein
MKRKRNPKRNPYGIIGTIRRKAKEMAKAEAKAAAMQVGGLAIQTYNIVEKIPDAIVFPDKSNSGRQIGLMIVWKQIADMAEKKYKALIETMVDSKLLRDYKQMNTPGVFTVAKSNNMEVKVSISVPRKEFNLDWFCNAMLSEYNVPIAATKMIYEQAKQPGAVQTRKLMAKEEAEVSE